MAEQLAFDLPATVRLGADDFFVSPANEQAFAMVRTPAAWPDGKLALIGPSGSGKTHLAGILAAEAGLDVITASDIDPAAPLPTRGLIVEDGEGLAPVAEEWLFHTHNHLRAQTLPLLLTGRSAPARWDIALPDLRSRLVAATTARIGTPDDPLLMAVLLKHFSDRQLMPAPDVIAYLQRHLPRSFEAIRATVRTLDRAALEQGKPLTRPFVRDVLDSVAPDTR
ncbi:HdaA/DnaA family protein [Pseudooctadecabacter jejudonensis]|uniref:DnaA regulatory inactivator Hda n=1 Tax=Pseudooctadecabacter jejudonensis TaxID=1391910 RepID=A0A1Y5SFJ1_9RHOB|nr:hypothetical protein [Pseudooctadecabacter jejudonensis]SLN39543.1 DnaA regulatory inactivator Hda [Pseudooctadecabacter jejudonensis]